MICKMSLICLTFAPMKTVLNYFLLLFLFGMQANAQVKCPANFDGKSFEVIKNEMARHKGETVAFDATVAEIGKGYNNIPYFSVRLENGALLWIASMVSDKYVVKGAKLRLVGYIDMVQADDAIASQFNQSGYHIRVFAMLDHKTKQLQISNAFDKEVKDWLGGKIPSDLGK